MYFQNSEVRGDVHFLDNGSVNMFLWRQILGKPPVVGQCKHIPMGMRMNGVLCGSTPRIYDKDLMQPCES
jgi:hypothetical protein